MKTLVKVVVGGVVLGLAAVGAFTVALVAAVNAEASINPRKV